MADRMGPDVKTPWNPSRKATQRVVDPLPVPTVHDCGSAVEIAHHNDIYGRAFSDWPWVYRCKQCDAHVGMHPFTNLPLGTLANKELRTIRQDCKAPFERLRQSGMMTRSVAYAELAVHLGIPMPECHFGLFNKEQCERAKVWAEMALRRSKSSS